MMTGTTSPRTAASWLSVVAGVVFGLLLVLVCAGWLGMQDRGVVQPFPYNHAVHTAKAKCVLCHRGVRSGAHAGLPDLTICAQCHATAPGKHPSAEQKALWKKVVDGKEVPPWQRLYRLPEHVYFSHRRHVQIGGLACETCHGDMGKQRQPPRRALRKLKMRNCLGCHEEKHVTQDCTACHR
ncbi:MAG: hypothetical protein D6729_04225 [Deltaproteobacteria bacterium]|nr:MAG: hypothetical protein D6729_04225 [Deltaproteobacteria bacterium]